MSPGPGGPGFDSAVLDRCPRPDHLDLIAVPLPPGAPTDPAWWAGRLFGGAGFPRWVTLLLGVRQLVVRLVGIPPASRDVFAVDEVVGEEAVIEARDVHLDFFCAVGVDGERRLLRVTTAVALHGWRGRLYWSVVRLFHGPVLASMLRRATRG